MHLKRTEYPHKYSTSGDEFKKLKSILTGMRYGRLVVLGLPVGLKSRQSKWVCKCDCGFFTITFGFSLTSGKSLSCGCIAAEKSKQRWINATPEMREERSRNAPSAKHRKSNHVLFRVWTDMKQRCLNPNNKFYHQYGARGINVCDRWMDFENFFSDMHDSYEKGLQIGRIDNDLGYSLENCRWETRQQNQRNRSNTVFVDTPDGRMLILDAMERYKLGRGCIKHRIAAGWSVNEVFLTPSERSKK